MKKSIASFITLTLTICVLLFVLFPSNETIDLSYFSTKGLDLDYTVSTDSIQKEQLTGLDSSFESFTPYLGKSFVGFKEALAFKESTGDYSCVNTFGYLGKYQFGKETLRLIGINNTGQFLKNPKLQEKAFIANAARNKWILRRDIKNFVGKRINGIVITESGILAAAHLGGAGNVKKYLRSYGLDNFSDGLGTTVHQYMKRFSGYDTSFIKPNKKAKAI